MMKELFNKGVSKMNSPKILVFDIETAPNVVYTWGVYEQNAIEVVEQWYVLCWAAKWYGQKKVITSSLPDFKLYDKDPKNDIGVLEELWELLDEADIVIGHNGDNFDVKKVNARFIFHGMEPPSPYKTIDTLKVARKHFKFTSNRLDALGEFLGVGRKEETGGFKLWKGCMDGVKKSWSDMVKYNKQDVALLEKVYNKLRPWMTVHPNLNVITGNPDTCPVCQAKNTLIKRGTTITPTRKRQNYQCAPNRGGCGRYSSGELIPQDQKIVVR